MQTNRYQVEFIGESRAGPEFWVLDTKTNTYLDRLFEDEDAVERFVIEMNAKDEGRKENGDSDG